MPLRRDYSRVNYDEIRAKLNEIDWAVEFSDKDVNKCYEIFLKFHEEIIKTINELYLLQNLNDVTRVQVSNIPSMLHLVFTRSSKEIDYLKFNPCLGKFNHVV